MQYKVPNGETFEIDTVVLDLNGTLSVNGKVPEGARDKLNKLVGLGFKIILFTGDQRGTADRFCKDLGIEYRVANTSEEKEKEMLKLEVNKCVAIGNARIDIGTFKHAKLSILTLQAEGIHVECLKHVDIIVPSILDALDLLMNKDSLCATLRE